MSNLLSKIIPLENKKDKQLRQGNGIAIFCGIVSIITCCFSCNIAYNRYEEAKRQCIQASQLIEKAGSQMLDETSAPNDAMHATGKRSPFI